MKAALANFIQRSCNPKVMLHEGNAHQLNNQEAEAIRKGGDRAFAYFLGTQKNISIVNANLDKQTQITSLLEKHSLELVYALRLWRSRLVLVVLFLWISFRPIVVVVEIWIRLCWLVVGIRRLR